MFVALTPMVNDQPSKYEAVYNLNLVRRMYRVDDVTILTYIDGMKETVLEILARSMK